jgi:FMN-dependent NADH-azoreductase
VPLSGIRRALRRSYVSFHHRGANPGPDFANGKRTIRMTKLLFIKASPRDDASRSVAVARQYLEGLRAKISDLTVDTIDLWQENLPQFDGDRANAKLAVITGQTQTADQKTAWDQIVSIASRFIMADRYLFAVPMWNSGIPYRLKQYIDIIHQPGLTFGLKPDTGYFGLLTNKKATLVYTSGAFSEAAPSPAFGVDHQSTYMRAWLNQAGITDIEEIRYQPTLLSGDPEDDFARAKQAASARAA